MLTVDFGTLEAPRGKTLLDLGCGGGRHTFEALRRGMHVVALDLDGASLKDVAAMCTAMTLEGQAPFGSFRCVQADAVELPFAADSFYRVIASEVLEHIEDDVSAIAEIARVLGPGGRVAVTVPRWWPERVCWALSGEYHEVAGGHVRIFRLGELLRKFGSAGFTLSGIHHAHALHSPYWWLRCAAGPSDEEALLPRLYHRLLVWQIENKPAWLDLAERLLNPVLGKSLVLYFDKADEEGVWS